MNVSFQNIAPETPEQRVTDFFETCADIEGSPLYVRKTYNGVELTTGTRVYQVTNLYQHIPQKTAKHVWYNYSLHLRRTTRIKRISGEKKTKTKQLQQK